MRVMASREVNPLHKKAGSFAPLRNDKSSKPNDKLLRDHQRGLKFFLWP
jgi:hypothetical protein